MTEKMAQTIWLYDLFWNLLKFKVPPIISALFDADGIISSNFINVEENEWKYLEGKQDFGECMRDIQKPKCMSIFDPEPKKNQ